ncbi:cytochrome B6 [Cyanobium sp. WAJ14-Wanaka]|uniref:cytochrome B6 n=2 Tax=unclassified Cyanobium TaxID=2627006 RepID=UPI0037BED581
MERGLLAAMGAPYLGFSTAGDAANGLLFGWDIADFQKWALIYLGISSLAFVVVWVVGYLRRA